MLSQPLQPTPDITTLPGLSWDQAAAAGAAAAATAAAGGLDTAQQAVSQVATLNAIASTSP